jgi:orotate phosphoribosyltransferase
MRVDQADIERLKRAMEEHCIRRSDTPLKLSSGGTAYYYYNGKAVTLRPSLARTIGRLMLDPVLQSGAEGVGGVAVGGIPLADAVGAAALEQGIDLPTFYVRQQPKEHGAADAMEAASAYADDGPLLRPGRKLALVEDVVTTGGSLWKAVRKLQELGCELTAVVTLVERHEGGGAGFREAGIPFHRLFYTDESGALFRA